MAFRTDVHKSFFSIHSLRITPDAGERKKLCQNQKLSVFIIGCLFPSDGNEWDCSFYTLIVDSFYTHVNHNARLALLFFVVPFHLDCFF